MIFYLPFFLCLLQIRVRFDRLGLLALLDRHFNALEVLFVVFLAVLVSFLGEINLFFFSFVGFQNFSSVSKFY